MRVSNSTWLLPASLSNFHLIKSTVNVQAKDYITKLNEPAGSSEEIGHQLKQVHSICVYNLPNYNNDEIQHVPTVSHIGVLMHHQTVSNNLQKGLNCENYEEGILDCFLRATTTKIGVNKVL